MEVTSKPVARLRSPHPRPSGEVGSSAPYLRKEIRLRLQITRATMGRATKTSINCQASYPKTCQAFRKRSRTIHDHDSNRLQSWPLRSQKRRTRFASWSAAKSAGRFCCLVGPDLASGPHPNSGPAVAAPLPARETLSKTPQTDLVTEVTEHKQEFTEKDFAVWSWSVWIHLWVKPAIAFTPCNALCPPACLCDLCGKLRFLG